MNKANRQTRPDGKEMTVLKENFPSCFNSDGSFDIDRFRELLSGKVNITGESYELKFLGKNYARLLASMDASSMLVPDREHNSRPENANSKNIYISGDNLDGLKHLSAAYRGSVGCIYIDPPYNTGGDGFAYRDKFKFTASELSEKLDVDEEQARRILDMTKAGSASHSAYLMYMYPRLIMARVLLSEDGVIFISADDNECCNLKLLCDEVFGERNFAGQLPRVTKRSGKDHSNAIASNHDFLLVYLKNCEKGGLSGINAEESDYKERDEYYEERGAYKLNQTLDYNSLWYNPAMDYKLTVDGKDFYAGGDAKKHRERHAGKHNSKDWVWRWSRAKFEFGCKNGFVVIKNGRGRPRIYTKTYYKAKIVKSGTGYSVKKISRDKKISSLEFTDNKYSNDNATKELGGLMDKNLFDFPKPTSLIRAILELLPDNITVMDFFSGSGTTGHAVMQLNAEDGGSRRFILIQLDEPLKENSYGFRSIDELGMARLKNAAEKITKENPGCSADLGFKHYTLREPSGNSPDMPESFDL